MRTPEAIGFLCTYPTPYDYSTPFFECRSCTAVRLAREDEFRVMREDAQDWSDHLAVCRWCSGNRDLLPKGLLFQACVEIRRTERKVVAA